MPVQVVRDFALDFIYVKILIAKLLYGDFLEATFHFLRIKFGYFHGMKWFSPPNRHGE